jgi:hypothetical protein
MKRVCACTAFAVATLSGVIASAQAPAPVCTNPATFCEGDSGYYVSSDDREKVEKQVDGLLRELRTCVDKLGGRNVSPAIVVHFDADGKPATSKIEAPGYESAQCVIDVSKKLGALHAYRETSVRCERGCPKPKTAPPPPKPPPVATPAPTPAPAPPPPPPASTGPRQGSATIHIEGADGASLERSTGGGWEDVCTAPCDKEMPLEGAYRLSGGGIRDSNGFAFGEANPGDRVTIRTNTSSSVAHGFGIGFVIAGPIIGFTGIFVAAIASLSNEDAGEATGLGMMLFGLITTPIGVGMLIATGPTKASPHTEPRATPPAPPKAAFTLPLVNVRF